MPPRGAFLLFEGLDRCGKTTQTKLLHEALTSSSPSISSTLLHFPDRSTAIGKSIHSYLTSSAVMDDHAIHLLFSANRWEAATTIESLLASGQHVILDRYSFSGVAFSAAKTGMSLDWCWAPEIGLPKPDAVIFLDVPVAQTAARANFGQERYESLDFQEKVRQNFYAIMERTTPKWHIVDATGASDQVHLRVLNIAKEVIAKYAGSPLNHFDKL
uniref:Thymidylate kinase n=1 Tax=Hyaloperonospora arabidopsidis (strain Emoy2) TaxID=559515 RepID=M4B3S6_HYAAE